MTATKEKCVSCEQDFNEDELTYSNVKNQALCYDCENEDTQSASTLVKIHGGEIDRVRIGDYTIYDDDAEIPDFLAELHTGDFKGRLYQKTDGWRGHYETVKNLDNVAVLASGWTTGWADEYHQRKIRFNNFLNEIGEGNYPTPYPFYALMELTSNVFSQTVDVFCLKKDEENVRAWLEEIGYPADTLKEWLS